MEKLTVIAARVRYLTTEPMAWWFSTAFATALLGAYFIVVHDLGVAVAFNFITMLNFVGLYQARGRLRFILVRTKYAPEIDASPV